MMVVLITMPMTLLAVVRGCMAAAVALQACLRLFVSTGLCME